MLESSGKPKIAMLSAAAALILLGTTAPAVHAAKPESWVCTIEAPANPLPAVSYDTARPAEFSPVRELAQIVIAPGGAVTTGTLFHETGAGCEVPISAGQLTLGSNNVGTLTLTLAVGTLMDEDGDAPCTDFFGGLKTPTENFHAIMSKLESEILLTGAEVFVTPAPLVTAEGVVPVNGRCVRQ